MKPRKLILPVATMAGLALVASSARALTIYSDDFSGDSSTDLHDTTPDVTTGDEKWVATSNYKANGSFTLADFATMTLPFTPINGVVYTLDAQIEDLGGSQWAQFGFGNGQPTTTVWSGRAWNLLRVAADTGNNHATSQSGLTGLTNWSNLGLLRYSDDLDVRIVLDTTGGTGSWTATYYAKAGNVGTYTEVGSKTLTDETIDSVGFSTYNVPNEGKLNSFSLSYESGSNTTPPTLASVDIVDDQSGGPVAVGTPITYTLTFSEDMDHLTFNPTDFWDAGSDVSFGFLSITETSPGVIEVVVTPDNPGTLQFQVNPGATLNDAAGNPLDTSAAIVDDTAITVRAEITPPTLASVDIVDDQAGGPVAVGTPITYTLTFSEDMDHLTFNPTDFWDAGSDVSFGFQSITETSPGVIELVVTPDNPGTLQFQVNPGATLNDAAGNPLDTSAAIVDDTAITVTSGDTTPPTLASVDIVDDQAGGPVAVGTPITYTLTFSEDMDRLTFNPTDFWDAGSDVSFGFLSITETSPGVIELVVTPDNPGTLQFQVNPGATLNDAAGNPLDTSAAIVDDTAITVRAEITPPTLASVDIVDDQAGGPVAVGTPITYTLTFSEDMDHLTFNPTDFWDAGSDVSFGFQSITETSPGVIEVVVSADNPGILQFQVNAGATLNDAAGNPLDTSAAIIDDTAINVTSAGYSTWATGNEPFNADSNGDGVADGIAFLLGAANPGADATNLLPTVGKRGGGLVMEFDCLALADRGVSVLELQYDGDFAAPWTSVPVPGAVGNTTVGNVSFVATANGSLIHIVATVDDATEAAAGKLFGRLEGTK